jgi:hypothetical protein
LRAGQFLHSEAKVFGNCGKKSEVLAGMLSRRVSDWTLLYAPGGRESMAPDKFNSAPGCGFVFARWPRTLEWGW